MSTKTRVLNVRVVGFSAPERQMLNSIFLLSVAPARQIGYKLWNPEAGVAPDMYLLDGDSESAVASWQATFSSTSDRTLVVGSKNTDLEMPNMNGLELTSHVRSRAELASLPVIMITSRSMDKHRRQAMASGVDVYLTKPYTDQELLQHVATALTNRIEKRAAAG